MNVSVFQRYDIAFVVTPAVHSITESSFQVRVRASHFGIVYSVAIEKAVDLGKLFNFQIKLGYDKFNQPQIGVKKELAKEFTVFTHFAGFISSVSDIIDKIPIYLIYLIFIIIKI